MYGIINKALKDMILERFGTGTWTEVLSESGVPDESFLRMRSYDDQVTYALVGAASKVLKAPAEDCLDMFGVYWVETIATKDYATLMGSAGSSLVEFLKNLNAMHDRIATTFLDYVPPYFRVDDNPDGSYLLHYISSREGLTPFVRGLLKGLAARFSQQLVVLTEEEVDVDIGSHTVFHIELQKL